jgi:hypothetical protein
MLCYDYDFYVCMPFFTAQDSSYILLYILYVYIGAAAAAVSVVVCVCSFLQLHHASLHSRDVCEISSHTHTLIPASAGGRGPGWRRRQAY